MIEWLLITFLHATICAMINLDGFRPMRGCGECFYSEFSKKTTTVEGNYVSAHHQKMSSAVIRADQEQKYLSC